ncbi:Lysosomal & prostatic acid phosphatases [Phaffia rhodozyma]|uniref:Lysosomal & prostatic acid phosphatases n=1 Tax=Phaffia rhodozyma TaxID=264483 RepID=A0A0F7SR27_PHARH|nr:Lysosomal & prostatic acid phosphatases [Phaffia rhodozyma]
MSSTSSPSVPPTAFEAIHPTVQSAFFPGSNLKLEQVHIFSRHGERTPVRVRMTNLFPIRWNMCHVGREFDAAVLEETGSSGILRVNRKVDVPRGPTKEVAKDGDCLLGELTDIGRKTSLALGQSLRKLYVDELGFLPSSPNAADLFLRSTSMSRTIETLQQITTGLYPSSTRGSWRPDVHIRNPTEESLYPNTFSCARLRDLDKQFSRAAALAYNDTLKPLDKKIGKHVGGKEIRVDSNPSASGIMDSIRAAEANGLKIPAEFNDPDVRDTLERAIVSEWFGGVLTSNEVRTLASGRLLSDLQHEMADKVAGKKDSVKMAVLACHDTTLASMLATLGVFDNRWPDFTAHVSVELFSTPPEPTTLFSRWTKPTPPRHYVRFRYQNKPLALPACAQPENHLTGVPELCTFEAFQKAVEKVTPLDWEKECAREE